MRKQNRRNFGSAVKASEAVDARKAKGQTSAQSDVYRMQQAAHAAAMKDERFCCPPPTDPTRYYDKPWVVDVICDGDKCWAVVSSANPDLRGLYKVSMDYDEEAGTAEFSGEPKPTESTMVYASSANDMRLKDHEAHIRAVVSKECQTVDEPVHAKNVVHCKATGSELKADKWVQDEPCSFCWMPAGVHQIEASRDGAPIQLTVECDEETAGTVQASLEEWRTRYPKQKPFGCIEHREEEAALYPESFAWGEDGVMCTATPSALGAKNVNGRIHRSWSPSFHTDADYDKAKEVGGMLVFPAKARGGRDNPARITGVAFSCGSLTNKPAFKAIPPVRAKEAHGIVEAAGTSEGAEKGWLSRRGFPSPHKASSEAWKATTHANETNTQDSHYAAAMAHHSAYTSHKAHWANAVKRGDDDAASEHEAKGKQHHSMFVEHHDKSEKLRPSTNASQLDINLAVHAEQAPQPETPNAEQTTKGTMKKKVWFIKARGNYAAGSSAELDESEANAAIQAKEAVESEFSAMSLLTLQADIAKMQQERVDSGKNAIKAKVVECKRLGKIAPKDDAVEAKAIERFDKGVATLEVILELLDGLAVSQDPAALQTRQTPPGDQGGHIEAGEVSGADLVRAAIKACKPFTDAYARGGMVRASKGNIALAMEQMDLAREKTRLLAKLHGEMQGGFVIRAANYIDPAANNPLGLLNTELLVLQNLGHLEAQLAPLRDITMDIAGVPVLFNQQVRSRYFTIPKVQLKTSSTAWSGGTGTNVDVNVPMDTYAGVEIAIPNEISASTPRNIHAEQRDPQLYALGRYITYKLVRTIIAGNTRIANDNTTSTILFCNGGTGQPAPFNISGPTLRTFTSDIPAAMDLAEFPGGDEPDGAAMLQRFAWVHTNPYSAATADGNFVLNQSIQSLSGGNSTNGNVMETGRFQRLGNIKFRKSQLMTDQASASGTGADGTTNGITVAQGDYNAATTVGFAGVKSALLFVTRIPEDWTQVLPGVPQTAALEVVTSPHMGISFLIVKYLDNAYEVSKMRVQLMFGFGIGDERMGLLLQK